MRKIFICLLLQLTSIGMNAQSVKQTDKEGQGIPDSTSAIKFAKQKWILKYGKGVHYREPLTVSLIGDSVWEVHSEFKPIKKDSLGRIQSIYFGGYCSIKVRRNEGKVISILCTK